MRLLCDGCETPIRQGFVKGRRLVCGRRVIKKSVPKGDGFVLKIVKSPGCSA